MDQPATCSATTFFASGCVPLNSDTLATSSHCSLGADKRGRKKRNAAPLIDPKTPTNAPSGSKARNERRDLSGRSLSMFIGSNPWLIHHLTLRAQLFFPAVAIGQRSRQNNFRITTSRSGKSIYSEPRGNTNE